MLKHFIFFPLMLIFAVACSTAQKNFEKLTMDVEQIKEELANCEDMITADKIQKKLQRLKKNTNATKSFKALVELMLGQLDFISHRNRFAAVHFQNAVQLASSDAAVLDEANLGLARIEPTYNTRLSFLLSKVRVQNLDLKSQYFYWELKGGDFLVKNHFWDALEAYAHAAFFIKYFSNQRMVALKKRLIYSVEQVAERGFKERIELSESMLENPLGEVFSFYQAAALALRDPKIADQKCQQLLAKFSVSPYAGLCIKKEVPIIVQEPVVARRVGVLLPMTGRFSGLAHDVLLGIAMALEVFEKNLEFDPIELIIEDTGEDNRYLLSGFQKLVQQGQVMAVIGPLLNKNAELCFQEALKNQVPLISLVRKATPVMDYVFHFGLTVQNETIELARLAQERLGVKRFAIVASQEKASQEAAFLFWDAVLAQGGEVTGFQTYAPYETDFRELVDQLSGLYYALSRPNELKKLAQFRAQNKIGKKTKKTLAYYAMSPIIDYDAVFFSDNSKIATQIMPTFSYRDIENLKFLGLSNWNTEEFVSRAEKYASQCYFVDLPLKESHKPFLQKLESYDESETHRPLESFTLSAYDAGLFVYHHLKNLPQMRRSLLNAALQKNLSSSFNEAIFYQNQMRRNLLLFTVRNRSIQEL